MITRIFPLCARAARESGYRTTGEWAYLIVTRELREPGALKEEIERWKKRALDAEREAARLERHVALLEAGTREGAFKVGS